MPVLRIVACRLKVVATLQYSTPQQRPTAPGAGPPPAAPARLRPRACRRLRYPVPDLPDTLQLAHTLRGRRTQPGQGLVARRLLPPRCRWRCLRCGGLLCAVCVWGAAGATGWHGMRQQGDLGSHAHLACEATDASAPLGSAFLLNSTCSCHNCVRHEKVRPCVGLTESKVKYAAASCPRVVALAVGQIYGGQPEKRMKQFQETVPG